MNYLGVYAMLSIALSLLVFVFVPCNYVSNGRINKVEPMTPLVLFFSPLIVPVLIALDVLKKKSLEWYLAAFIFYLSGVVVGVFISN